MLKKFCPNCGSEEINFTNENRWVCVECSFSGNSFPESQIDEEMSFETKKETKKKRKTK